jgi:hypothetical protein
MMDRQFRRMGFRHNLVSKFFVLGHYESVFEPKNSFVINLEVLGFLLFHLPFDVKHTRISLLKLDDSTSKRAINSDIVEHHWVKEMG